MLMRFLDPSRGRLFQADGGSTAGATGTHGDATGQTSQTADTANGGTTEKSEKAEKTFTQAELDRIVEERLAREKKQREAAADKARKEAEEKTLLEQGEFKTLAEQRAGELAAAQAKLEAAKAVEARAEKHEKALKAHVEALLKDAPKHLTELLAKLDAAEQLAWITANPDALKTTEAAKPTPRGTPVPTGQQGRRPAPQTTEPASPRKRVTL